MDKAKDLEEDVNESQFQEFLKFCTHVNPSKQETRNHCMLNYINIMRETEKKKRQWMLNLINIRRGDKEKGRQDNSFGDGYKLYL
jgi:NAD kinase